MEFKRSLLILTCFGLIAQTSLLAEAGPVPAIIEVIAGLTTIDAESHRSAAPQMGGGQVSS